MNYMRYHQALLFLSFMSLAKVDFAKEGDSRCKLYAEQPYIGKKGFICLNVSYTADSSFKGNLLLRYYKFQSNNDSLPLLEKTIPEFSFRTGLHKLTIEFKEQDSTTNFNQTFCEILKKAVQPPSGSYGQYIQITCDRILYEGINFSEMDSSLDANSDIRVDLDRCFQSKPTPFVNSHILKATPRRLSAAPRSQLISIAKADKAIKKHGLTSLHGGNAGKKYIDLFYKDWFVGRYQIKNSENPIDNPTKSLTASNFNSVTSDDLGHPSLFSQYKKLGKGKSDKADRNGEIGITTNVSAGQEQYSGINSNYYELRGSTEMAISNIPLEFEGFYTSQDVGRQIKSSYFRVHYDVEKMKGDFCP